MRVVLALTLLVGVSACGRPQAESNNPGRAGAEAPRAHRVRGRAAGIQTR